MAVKNDERILELKRQIDAKKTDLKQHKVRFIPETNCLLELDGSKYNLNVCSEDLLGLLLIKLNMYVVSAVNLGVNIPELSGYAIEKWMSDIKNKINEIKLREEEKKLKENERLLEKLLSEDKKTELMLDEIAASLA